MSNIIIPMKHRAVQKDMTPSKIDSEEVAAPVIKSVTEAVKQELAPSLTLPTHLVIENQLKSLYKARERKVVEAICRATGRTDYETYTIHDLAKECEVEQQFYGRGKWREYPDSGEAVFVFDGKDMLLFGPIVTDPNDPNKLIQRVEELYDKRALRAHHHTREDERG